MKIFLSIVLVCIAAFAIAHTPSPKAPMRIYDRIHYSPILIYATVGDSKTDENRNTIAKLTIKEVIKGNFQKNMVLNVKFTAISKSGGRVPVPQSLTTQQKKVNNDGETRIYALYKNTQKETDEIVWDVSPVGGFLVNTAQKVAFGDNNITIPDFKAGIALFEAKYTYFQEKRANNISIILENPIKNRTFAFLAKEMMGNLIYTPKKGGKVQRKVQKKVLKKVKRKQ